MNVLIAGICFSVIGFSAWRYGKRIQSTRHMLVGGALMVYPYVIYDLIAVIVIGLLLTALLFWP